ncbi:MAG: hypothetical protein U0Y10_13890 [Spirosomataceae bacterium]
MSNTSNPLQDLSEIRSLMERSSRFLSLSGLSGIFAGACALVGALVAAQQLGMGWDFSYQHRAYNSALYMSLFFDALGVLVLALAGGIYFTTRQARKKNLKIWDSSSKRLLINLFIPLITGGLFCLLLLDSAPSMIPSATLIFYGLALLNGSKYTLNDVRYLGICELVLGLICGYFEGSGLSLLFWALGFGVLHIVYGIVMYRKYEG